jgi:hypothetical protein
MTNDELRLLHPQTHLPGCPCAGDLYAACTCTARQFAAAPELLAALIECRSFIFALREAQLVGQYCIDADYRVSCADKAMVRAKP